MQFFDEDVSDGWWETCVDVDFNARQVFKSINKFLNFLEGEHGAIEVTKS